MEPCKIITFLGAVVSLILTIVILTKLNKKGWCGTGEGFVKTDPKSKGMVLKSATNACAYLGDSLNSDGNYNGVYPCGKWASENKKDGNCTLGNGAITSCFKKDGMYGPLDCCEAICQEDSSYKNDYTVHCSDPNAS